MAKHFIVEGLRYHIAGRAVIDDVSLTLAKGELMAFVGPNGAGKSILLRLLAGFLKPATGRCMLAGRPPEERPTQTLLRHRAVMRRQAQFGSDWPVEAAIMMGYALWTRRPESGLIAQVMEMTECAPLAGRQYVALSDGEQQRVQSARTLAQLWCDGVPHGWLFPDEPTSVLDFYHQQHLLRMLKTLTASGGLHVCIVLHDLSLAVLWVDRVVLPHNSRLVSQGTLETMLQADDLKRWYGAQVHVGQHLASASP